MFTGVATPPSRFYSSSLLPAAASGIASRRDYLFSVMARIILATLNARYAHCSFGLRYLLANLGELQAEATLQEYTIADRAVDIVEGILATLPTNGPRIVGLGIYIWNARESVEVVALLKQLAPDVFIVLGGPEVSHEWDRQEIVALADALVKGEGERCFLQICRSVLAGVSLGQKLFQEEPALSELTLPYHLYSDADIANRTIYVEASRGCVFKCEFCLSSLDRGIRAFPLDTLLVAFEDLLARGARSFKFVDRTFNVSAATSSAILRFFLERYTPGLFLHFEMVPDRLPEPIKEILAQFPPGAVQLEVGIQTFTPAVLRNISRRQDEQKLASNFGFLRDQTGVHIHADLIVGLPGEHLSEFAAGFDRLFALKPQEIQVGILKRLRGAPVERHTDAFEMRYAERAPYELLCSNLIDFSTMQRLKRFARFWDLVHNSGRFPNACALLLGNGSAFEIFLTFSDWLFRTTGKTHGINQDRLAELLFAYLQQMGRDPSEIRAAFTRDFGDRHHNNLPPFLKYGEASRISDLSAGQLNKPNKPNTQLPKRQRMHSATALTADAIE